MNNQEKRFLDEWQKYRNNVRKATPINLDEAAEAKHKRVAALERDHEAWFKYYFPNFAYAEPADFHKAASRRVMNNPEWYEVRAWSRELAKSTRTMMEVLKLAMTGQKRNVLLVSNSSDNAKRLLLPYKIQLEDNNRLINDYGDQKNLGLWEADEFTTKKGVSFRAVGAGQSPRGSRNNEVRPDCILIDDIDTDEECRNPDIIEQKVEWIEEALIPTRSISEPLLVIVCGNVIAENCCVSRLMKYADKVDMVNIRDKEGKSTWASKNSEEAIDRILSLISYESGQKEYFNNPLKAGKTFKNLQFGKLPKLSSCDTVVIYCDPATANKASATQSYKGVVIVARKSLCYYVAKVWLDRMTNDQFIESMYLAVEYLRSQKVEVFKLWLENNSLQNPFYEQVLLPIINEKNKEKNTILPLLLDNRKKPDKHERIEANLEPLDRNGKLIFNEVEEKTKDMEVLVAQFRTFSHKSKHIDGPDAVDGGISLDRLELESFNYTYEVGFISQRKY